MKDISLLGAFLSSTFTPPMNAEISIKLESSLLNAPIILPGKIVRHNHKDTDKDTTPAFAVRFNHSAPALVILITNLANPKTP
jgi:hypothetical protein